MCVELTLLTAMENSTEETEVIESIEIEPTGFNETNEEKSADANQKKIQQQKIRNEKKSYTSGVSNIYKAVTKLSPAGKVDFEKAKGILSAVSSKTNLSLYDHLTSILNTIVRARIKDAVDIFEEISYLTKKRKYSESSSLKEVIPPDVKLLAFIESEKSMLKELKSSEEEKEILPLVEEEDEEEEDEEEEDAKETPKTCLFSDFHYHLNRFKLGGIVLSTEEANRLNLGFKRLVHQFKLNEVRFWGKIFGTKQNYYIAEAPYQDNVTPEDFAKRRPSFAMSPIPEESEVSFPEKEDEDEENPTGSDVENSEEENTKVKKTAGEIIEENGIGINEYLYFVCNEIGESWRCLPSLKPNHIFSCRRLSLLLTGNLDADIRSGILTGGKEAYYLRVQIARISASTYIAPKDFFKFPSVENESEEEDEETPVDTNTIIKNTDYISQPPKELISEGLDAWVHIRKVILDEIGRCTIVKPESESEEKESEEKESEEETEIEEEVEIQPIPLLQSLANDRVSDELPLWSFTLTSKLAPETAVLVVRSNSWPGAFTYYDGKECETIYIGNGIKQCMYHYGPLIPTMDLKSIWAEIKEESHSDDIPSSPEEAEFEDEDED